MNATTSQSNTQSPSEHLKEIETMDTQQYLQATQILDYNSKEIRELADKHFAVIVGPDKKSGRNVSA